MPQHSVSASTATRSDGTFRNREKQVKLIWIGLEQESKTLVLHLRRCIGHTKVDGAGVRKVAANDQFTEVAVVGNEDATLPMRGREQFNVWKATSIVDTTNGDIMAELAQVQSDPSLDVLIEQESHRIG